MQNLRHELDHCFYLIPFTTMKMESFSNIVFANRVLFTLDEIVEIMRLIATDESTEVTKMFTNGCCVAKPFDWSKESLLVFAIENVISGGFICLDEKITFTSNQKLLFGGFRCFDMTNNDKSMKSLSATISVTMQLGFISIDERQEKIEIVQAQENAFVKLNQPIVIVPQIRYDICVTFSKNDFLSLFTKNVNGWSCSRGVLTSFVHEDVCIEFDQRNKDSVISQLHFSRL